MANVKINRPKVVTPPPTFTIELSLEEAKGLREVLGAGIAHKVAVELNVYELWSRLDVISEVKPINYPFHQIATK